MAYCLKRSNVMKNSADKLDIAETIKLLKAAGFKKRKLLKSLEKLALEYSTIVISGASSGIGQATLELVSTLPKNILICNISRSKSAIFFDRQDVENVPCDLSNLQEIDAAFLQIEKLRQVRGIKGGKILLINNSGFGGYGLFPEPNNAHNCNMIDVNVRGLTYLTGLFIPLIREFGGGVINVASTAAWQPCPYLSVYAATKAYVMSFSLALDYELKKFGARALCLCPGPTTTNFFKRAGFDERPLKANFGHEASDVAQAMLIAYAYGKNLKIVGLLNSVVAWLNYFIPRSVMGRISGFILAKVRGQNLKK